MKRCRIPAARIASVAGRCRPRTTSAGGADVGAAAADAVDAVEEPEHQGTTIREIRTAVDLTLTDLAAAVGRAQGIGHLPYQQLSDDETVTQLLQVGFSDDAAKLQIEMHHAFSAARVAATRDDPRAPTTVDDYLASLT